MNVFLASLLVAAAATGPLADARQWSDNYTQALHEAKQAKKPLLVILDKPQDPEQRFVQTGLKLDKTQAELLKSYKLCHIDATTPHGRKVVKAFGATELPHTAIIDKTGTVVLFSKTGQFSSLEWVTTLVNHKGGEKQTFAFTGGVLNTDNCFT